MMKARRVHGLLDIEIEVRDVDEDVGNGRDDRRAAGRPEHQPQLAVLENDGRCHRRQRPLVRGDGILLTLNQPEHVRRARLGGEVVHLVVHEKAERADGDLRSVSAIQGRRDRHGIACLVDHGVVRRLCRLLPCENRTLFRIVLEGGRDTRALQATRCTRLLRVHRFAPFDRIVLVGQLEHRQRAELRIAQELRAIVEGASIGFRDQVDGFSGPASGLRQIEPFENVQRLDQRDAAGGRRRGADDLESSIRAAHRHAILHFVVAQIIERNETAPFLHELGELSRHFSGVEIIRRFDDALERASQLRLFQDIALLPALAVVLEDALRVGVLREPRVSGHRARVIPAERITLARETNGRLHDLFQRQLAELFLRMDHALHRAWNTRGEITDATEIRDHIALAVLIHGGRCLGRRLLAEIEKVSFTIVHAHEHEATAADVAGRWMYYGKRESGRDRGIDRVATGLHHFNARLRGEFVHAHHHALLGSFGLHARGVDQRERCQRNKQQNAAAGQLHEGSGIRGHRS